MSIKKNPSLAGVVILYHPENDVLRNISSYIGQLDKLYVVDNSEKKNEILKKKIISNWGKKIHYCENVVNEGIAKPINTIARQAIIDGYAYLLTMDQDSAFKENTDFSKAILCIENNTRIALFNFNHHYKEFFRKRHEKKWIPIKYLYMLKEYICIKLASKESFLFSKTYEVITSGTIMNLSVFQEIGNMDENLFIDEVDHEYSLRAVKKGFFVMRTHLQYLLHSIGDSVMTYQKFFLFTIKKKRKIHNPVRIYYMYRNRLYVANKYKDVFPEIIKKKIHSNKYWEKKILQYYPTPDIYLQMIHLAKSDYENNIMGKLQIDNVLPLLQKIIKRQQK